MKGRVERALECFSKSIAKWSARCLGEVRVRPDVLTERAALMGLPEPSQISANGSCRLLKAGDRWLAFNLPRPEDLELVPALLCEPETSDPWKQLEASLSGCNANDLLEQARLLGLAVSAIGEARPEEEAHRVFSLQLERQANRWSRAPRVVDMSALWAGPLCGGLLAEAGCEVVKVEAAHRPDTIRLNSPEFFARLNDRKRDLVLDFQSRSDWEHLAGLIKDADVLITSVRRRAIDSLGLEALLRQRSQPLIWIAITGHGLSDPDAERIGFGDDCAAAGGLVAWRENGPSFIGDALADPLTGLYAAAVALRALASRKSGVFDIALSRVAAMVTKLEEAA